MIAEHTENSLPSPSLIPRWRWWIHLILIGGYFIPATVMSLIQLRERPRLTDNVRGLLFVCAFELVAFALVFGLGWSASRATRAEMFLSWRPRWWDAPLALAYAILVRIGVAAVGIVFAIFLLATHGGDQEVVRKFARENQPAVERLLDVSAMQHNSVYYWLALTLVSFVLAGLREEMWRAGTFAALRGLWPKFFEARVGQWSGMALIAIVFGAAHLQMGILAAVIAGGLGVFFGAIILWHRSIWIAVLAHGFFDAMSFALLPYAFESLRRLH